MPKSDMSNNPLAGVASGEAGGRVPETFHRFTKRTATGYFGICAECDKDIEGTPVTYVVETILHRGRRYLHAACFLALSSTSTAVPPSDPPATSGLAKDKGKIR